MPLSGCCKSIMRIRHLQASQDDWEHHRSKPARLNPSEPIDWTKTGCSSWAWLEHFQDPEETNERTMHGLCAYECFDAWRYQSVFRSALQCVFPPRLWSAARNKRFIHSEKSHKVRYAIRCGKSQYGRKSDQKIVVVPASPAGWSLPTTQKKCSSMVTTNFTTKPHAPLDLIRMVL